MDKSAAANKRILVVNGSYRDDGITDQAVASATRALMAAGAEIDTVYLRDYPIEFCLNCRECMQAPGAEPGRCVLDDGMQALIERIEDARAFVFASPTNFGSVTAVFKRFMERLAPYACWPWGQPYPRYRKSGAAMKKALLISSSASPGWLARWLFGSGRQLEMAAKIVGAKPVGLVFTGLVAQAPRQRVPARARRRIEGLARRLLE